MNDFKGRSGDPRAQSARVKKRAALMKLKLSWAAPKMTGNQVLATTKFQYAFSLSMHVGQDTSTGLAKKKEDGSATLLVCAGDRRAPDESAM